MKYAFFDFDGTLTHRDTFIEFACFSRGRGALIRAILVNLPVLIGWKLGICSNSKAKERLFSSLYKGMTVNRFDELGEAFAARINDDLRVDTLHKLREHQAAGHQVEIVSASVGNWLRPWAKSIGVTTVLCTEVEIDSEGRLTGRFRTPNCHGKEKARRIMAEHRDIAGHETWAYGDSSGDDEMLAMVTHPERV